MIDPALILVTQTRLQRDILRLEAELSNAQARIRELEEPSDRSNEAEKRLDGQ